MKAIVLATVSAIALAACAAKEPQPVTVSKINVSADLGAVTSREAARYWRNVDADVEAALAAEFVGRIDPSGKIVNVDIDEISLTNSLSSGLAPNDARLSGLVTIENADGTAVGSYNVSATQSQAASYLPEGATSVPMSSTEYYEAVVRAFARGTAEVVTGSPAS